MEAVAHNPAFAKKVGIKQSVGKEFASADKGKSFKQGGDMASKMNPGFMAMMAKKKGASKMAGGGMPMKDGKPAFIGDGKGMKNGGMKKMAMGGYATGGMPMGADGKPSFVGDGKGKMKTGGMAMKKMASGGMTSMGKVKTAAPSRDGVAERGKTKGKQIVMAGNKRMNKGGRAC